MLGGAFSTGLIGLMHNGTIYPMLSLMFICAAVVIALVFGARIKTHKPELASSHE
jgi:hypothetical protein